MSKSSPAVRSKQSSRLLLAQLAALVVAALIVAVGEIPRFRGAIESGSVFGWFADMNLDTTPFFLLLLVLPVCWIARRSLLKVRIGWFARSTWNSSENCLQTGTVGPREWILAVLVGLVSLGTSLWVSQRPLIGVNDLTFGDLPPAYHDEFSYRFQAETFRRGRLAFESHPDAPELFDQMHVLNDDGRFASRFFPGTGAWMLPFIAIERPYWGHWLAGALSAFFVFWAGRELGGNGAGLLAGMLTAVSPGMALFSNLLLAHHPALAGLTLFLFAFLRMMRTPRWGWALAAGLGLSFAMLCRPMTAAGFGLPFGLWFAWWLFRGEMAGNEKETQTNSVRVRCRIALALSMPIVAGLAVQLMYDNALTGNIWVTPYQRFTDIYTPRHVYGFNNVIRGERRLGPKVLDNYDRWAENLAPRLWERDHEQRLVPSLAVRNVASRLQNSLRWTLSIVPLAMGIVVFLVGGGGGDRRWWLILAAIVSLHAAHVPYWFDGMMHWHYVFETGPLWLLLFAAATQMLFGHWQTVNRPLMPLWWSVLIGMSLCTTYTSAKPFWNESRITAAVEEIAFSRKKYDAFQKLIGNSVMQSQALVLVEADPADRHIDYVTNAPNLNAKILFGRFLSGRTDTAHIQQLFPDRACYLYRAATGELIRLKPSG